MMYKDGSPNTDIPRTMVDLSQEVISTLCYQVTQALHAEGLSVDLRVNPYIDPHGTLRVIMNLDAVGWQVILRLAGETAQRRLDQRSG